MGPLALRGRKAPQRKRVAVADKAPHRRLEKFPGKIQEKGDTSYGSIN